MINKGKLSEILLMYKNYFKEFTILYTLKKLAFYTLI